MARGRRNGQLDPTSGLRRCTGCDCVKPVSEFNVGEVRDGRAYLRSQCRDCQHAQHRAWYRRQGLAYHSQYRKRKPAEYAAASRRHRLRKVFGMTERDYATRLAVQGGGCAICGVLPKVGKKRFPVDHDHASGQVRGILCSSCNTAIGLFNDDTDRMRAAALYVTRTRLSEAA